ncbi:Lipopolysaccharide assembly protein LapB [hydrothermal vent metagenome]|uniref:Lipopolysaccharide assembly protein LapB n=1 Tax=hydrothermal vent metagenome TaxID=652676 RepID=A0A3B1A0J6_9ZZZZ
MFNTIYLLFLLLPVAFISGYFLGHKKPNNIKLDDKNIIPSDYIKGLNFLLNEQPDKAVQVFIDLLEVNEETVETHLALGHLFRRRGEVNRAIRIHQNLVERTSIEPEQRARAIYQLGQDYLSAGLLDRAEKLFNELMEQKPQTQAAMQRLIEIYQQEKDWAKAIEITKRLAMNTEQDYTKIIAHYYCEQAEQMLRYNEPNKAIKLTKKAIRVNTLCARASIIEGQVLVKMKKYKEALKAYQRVEHQNPELLPEVIEQIKQCYNQLDQNTKMRDYVFNVQSQYGGISLVLAWVDVLAKENSSSAEEFLIAYLKEKASVRAMDKLIDIKQIDSIGSAQDNLNIIKSVTTQLLKTKSHYQCHSCGFLANIYHWQCPSCKGWDTIESLHWVDGE